MPSGCIPSSAPHHAPCLRLALALTRAAAAAAGDATVTFAIAAGAKASPQRPSLAHACSSWHRSSTLACSLPPALQERAAGPFLLPHRSAMAEARLRAGDLIPLPLLSPFHAHGVSPDPAHLLTPPHRQPRRDTRRIWRPSSPPAWCHHGPPWSRPSAPSSYLIPSASSLPPPRETRAHLAAPFHRRKRRGRGEPRRRSPLHLVAAAPHCIRPRFPHLGIRLAGRRRTVVVAPPETSPAVNSGGSVPPLLL
jgi:hypothetical protein